MDIIVGLKSRSMNPSTDCAHFNIMYGRCSVWNVKKRRFNSRHSSSITPTVTCMPASRSFFMPAPCTLANGSTHPTTTLATPLLTTRSAQGGVLP